MNTCPRPGDGFCAYQSFERESEGTYGVFETLSAFPRVIQVSNCTRIRRRRFFRKLKLLARIWGCLGGFRVAELVFEVYLSLRRHAHVQERVLTHIKAFSKNQRVPRAFSASFRLLDNKCTNWIGSKLEEIAL